MIIMTLAQASNYGNPSDNLGENLFQSFEPEYQNDMKYWMLPVGYVTMCVFVRLQINEYSINICFLFH